MRLRVDLLRVEAKVVRERQELLDRRPRLRRAARPRERLDEPERAREERALLGRLAAVAVEERPTRPELLADGGDRAGHALAGRVGEAHPRRAQHGGVELLRVRVEGVRAASLREAPRLDELADGLALLAPARRVVARELALVSEPERPVEGRPARELRDRVMAQVIELPDPGVLVAPDHAQAVEDVGEAGAGRVVEGVPSADVELGRLEQVAPAPELELRPGRVPVADGPRVAVAPQRELVEPLRDLALERVERPDVRLRLRDRAQEPRERVVHLLP